MSGQVKELKSKVIAQLVVKALEDLKGESIRSIDVQKLTEITDYMVIVTGRSSTHIKALSDSVAKRVKEAGLEILGMEGKLQSEWILVDVGGVVVHMLLTVLQVVLCLASTVKTKSLTRPLSHS